MLEDQAGIAFEENMGMFSIKIAFNFCCLLALFAVKNVSSVGGGPHDQQQQQDVPQPTGHAAIEGHPLQLHSSSGSSSAVAAEQHSSAHHQHQKLPQHQIPGSPSQEGESNIYPLSKKQEEHGRTQKIMEARIAAQLESGKKSDHSQIFLPELLEILENDERTVANVFIDAEKEWSGEDSAVKRWWGSTESIKNKRGSEEGQGEEVHVPDEQQDKTPKNILKFAIKHALGGAGRLGADITDLIEILVTTTNAQKDELGLDRKICSMISGYYDIVNKMTISTLMRHLCEERRDQSFGQDEAKAFKMASKIDDYLLNEDRLTQHNGKEEDMIKIEEICAILAKTNYSQLRLVFEQKPNGMTIRERLESFSWWKEIMRRPKFLQIIDYLLTDVQEGRPHMFARLLREKLGKEVSANISHNIVDARRDIARILITRAQIDLPDIVDAYNDHKYDMKHGISRKLENGLLNQLKMIEGKKFTDHGKRTLKAYIDIVTLVQQPGWMDRIDGNGQQH